MAVEMAPFSVVNLAAARRDGGKESQLVGWSQFLVWRRDISNISNISNCSDTSDISNGSNISNGNCAGFEESADQRRRKAPGLALGSGLGLGLPQGGSRRKKRRIG